MAKRRRFTPAFKAQVAPQALREERTVRQIATRHGVHPNLVIQWKQQMREGLDELVAFWGTPEIRASPFRWSL